MVLQICSSFKNVSTIKYHDKKLNEFEFDNKLLKSNFPIYGFRNIAFHIYNLQLFTSY